MATAAMPAGDSIHQGAVEARGIYGQHMYINPNQKLVIVVLSARPKPIGARILDDAAFFAAVARSLVQRDLNLRLAGGKL
jgi:CubicO group peptidase (beta-lactamase class C family)